MVLASTARMLRMALCRSRKPGSSFRNTRNVKMKSRAVTGTPSLQRASRRMWYVRVNGGFLVWSTRTTSFGRRSTWGPTSYPAGAARSRDREERDGEHRHES